MKVSHNEYHVGTSLPERICMVDRFEKFSLAISEIYRYWHKIAADELSEYHLKSSHAVYLTTLYRYPEGLTAPRLAELCGNQNRYRGTLKLTEEGLHVAEQISKRAALAVEKANEGITEEKRVIFTECLDIITKNLQRVSEEGL